jgi:hypothetical protein
MTLNTAEEARQEVQNILAQSPRRFGIAHNRWRLQDLQAVISWLQDKTLAGVCKILKRLKFTRQQVLNFIRSPDPLYQVKRRALSYAFMEAVQRPEEVAILFADDLTYYKQPTKAPVYWPRGSSQKRVWRAPGENVMTRVAAVLDGLTGRVIYQQGDHFGIAGLQQQYRRIRQLYPERKVYVVRDNWPIHKHDEVTAVARAQGLIPLYLPTYASWLNPIEKLWRWLKQDVLHAHHWAHDVSRLRHEVQQFLDQFASGSDELLRYVGLLPD